MRGFIIALALCGLSSAAFAQGTITTIHPSAPQQPTAISGPSGYLSKSNNLSDLSNAATARSNLGLPASAATDTTNASNITSGTLSVSRLPYTPANKAGDTFTGAVTIPFTQSGTGATARTVDAKLKDVVSVTDFTGVDKTGVADSTTGIQAAEAALEAAGVGTLVFPAGIYKISSCVTIAASNIAWKGAGAGATRIILSSGSQNGICLNGADVHSIEISGLQIEHSTSSPTAGFSIYFANTNIFDVKIHDITTFYCYVCIGTDIQTPGGTGAISDVSLTNFEFRDTKFGGIQAQSDIGWKISKGVISFASPQSVQPLANSFAIRLGDWTDGIWLTDLNLLGGDNTLIMESVFSSNQRAPAQIFAQNLSLDSGWNTALNIVDAHEFNFTGGSIGNLSGGNAVGAQISAGVGIKFTGTVFANVSKGCVNYSGGTYVAFDSVSLVSCSRAGSGTYHGIYIAQNQSYWSVRDSVGRVDTTWYGTGGQGYSLYIDTGNDHYVATNNLMTGVTAGIFNGSAAAANKTISGNVN